VDFDIIPLDKVDILLGMLWLKRYNPNINWPTGQVTIQSNVDSDEETDHKGNERSQTSTEDVGEAPRGRNISPPPKGTQYKHTKGKKNQNKRILGLIK
jgi:hypothetical protein